MFRHTFFSGGALTSDPVPAGTIWVVRNVDGFYQPGPYELGFGFIVLDDAGDWLYKTPNPFVSGGRPASIELRQVLNAGDHVTVNSDAGWSVSISGYELTTA